MLATGLLFGVAAASACGAAEPAASPKLSCRGEEPFWALQADGRLAALSVLTGRREAWSPPERDYLQKGGAFRP